MFGSLKQLDQILRGDATLMSSLRKGQIDVPVGGLALVTATLGVVYGACVGSFGVLHPDGNGWMQVLASAAKLPLLFLLTFAVTFPSLYVFNALVGSRLSMTSVLRLLVAMLGVTLAVLASLGPIVVFFSLSTTSYPFMKLLNVVVCAVAGFLGLAFLLRTLHRLIMVQEAIDGLRVVPLVTQASSVPLPAPVAAAPADARAASEEPQQQQQQQRQASAGTPPVEPRGALDLVGDRTSGRARTVFQIWIIVFALVGAQMSWVLRPFIGDPEKPFTWLRPREGNFFEGVLRTIGNLFGA